MALRQEDLLFEEAIVYEFPAVMARSRAARRRMMARRRMTLGVAATATAVWMLASLPTL